MDKGEFTTTYLFDYIYLHSADTKSVDDGHQSIEIPLKEVEQCDGCKGIHLEVEVLDDGSG